jgi:hypothetical protein
MRISNLIMSVLGWPMANNKKLSKFTKTTRGQRLLDLFTAQNPNNNWVDSLTAASWMHQTNSPSNQQISSAEVLMSQLGPAFNYSPSNAGVLERRRIQQAMGNEVIYLTYIYRLSSDQSCLTQ